MTQLMIALNLALLKSMDISCYFSVGIVHQWRKSEKYNILNREKITTAVERRGFCSAEVQ
jgi:hypothetical protein